jgi:GNAT superfamily N-acetyltransferase
MIGVVRASVRSPDDRSASYVRIHEIFVLPDFRSNGVAHDLLQFVTQWTKDLGAKRIELSVDIDNAAGMQFWATEDFKDYQRVMFKAV